MTDEPDIRVFPAARLGAFLRAMEDPEGTGDVDADRQRDIATIERRVSDRDE